MQSELLIGGLVLAGLFCWRESIHIERRKLLSVALLYHSLRAEGMTEEDTQFTCLRQAGSLQDLQKVLWLLEFHQKEACKYNIVHDIERQVFK